MSLAVDPATGLVAWHQSMLASLMRCGEQFRRRAIDREARPATTPQIRGSAVHRGIAAGLTLQMHSHVAAPPDLMEDMAATEIDRARHGGATLTAEEQGQGLARTWGTLKDHAVRYAGTYARRVAPAVHPVAVEHRVTLQGVIPGILLRGTLDLVDQVGPTRVVADAKTSERAPHGDAADRSQQLSLYDLLDAGESGPSETRPVRLDYLVLNRSTGTVEPVRLQSVRTAATRRAVVSRIDMAVKSVNAGVFVPANPETDWWCSERWCEFWSTCQYAIRP